MEVQFESPEQLAAFKLMRASHPDAVKRLLEQGERLESHITQLELLLTPRRIDDDTPDGVLVWDGESWENACRGATGDWMSGGICYYDEQPIWWLPMLPAPEEK